MAGSTQSDAPVRTHTAHLDDASFGDLAARLSEQVSRLVHDEMALAQLEAKQKAKRFGLGVGLFGAGGFVAVLGVICAVAAAVLGLATAVDGWLAALLVALALFVLAGLLAVTGGIDVRRGTPPIPEQAVESTKADVAAVREAVHR
jgi:putative superfamily III holin-X